MALWKPFRGSRATLDTVAKHDGYVYFCTDDGSLHFDYVDENGNLQRKQITTKEAETLVGCDITPEKIASWDSAIQNIETGVGLKVTQTGTDVALDIDDDIVFILDCGMADSDMSTVTLEDNDAGGQTAIIG